LGTRTARGRVLHQKIRTAPEIVWIETGVVPLTSPSMSSGRRSLDFLPPQAHRYGFTSWQISIATERSLRRPAPRGAAALRHNPYVAKRGASPRGYLNNSRFFHESRKLI
jgi:hypothetical protein